MNEETAKLIKARKLLLDALDGLKLAKKDYEMALNKIIYAGEIVRRLHLKFGEGKTNEKE